LIEELIEGVWPLKLDIKEGFMGKSTQEVLTGNPEKHERGEPDASIYHKEKHLFNVEVTGSFVSIKNSELWIRPDKVMWAIQHPNPQTWAFFVYRDKILRFCVNEAIDFPIEEREPNGVKEKYHIIPQLDAFEFKHLQRWKER